MPKCGFVALIGRPNAGKSTLLNRLVGQKVSIVSDKPQTTRGRLLGILNSPDAQIVFVDTPGVHRPGHRLNKRMMDAVYESLRGVDVVLHLVDASESFGRGEQYVVDLVRQTDSPLILLLNKVDLINKGRLLPMIQDYQDRAEYDEIIPVSALDGDNIDVLLEALSKRLPEGERLFPEESFTDQRERAMASELIREKVLLHTRQELPYSTAVVLEEFDESKRGEGFVRITASIIVDKPGQKKIVIGRSGSKIKTIGIEARKDLQGLLDVPRLFLDLNVKVIEGWRDRDPLLDEIGLI